MTTIPIKFLILETLLEWKANVSKDNIGKSINVSIRHLFHLGYIMNPLFHTKKENRNVISTVFSSKRVF